MIAVELVKDRKTKEPFSPDEPYPRKLARRCLDNGLMLRVVGNKLILSPPLIFATGHVDEAVRALDLSLAERPYLLHQSVWWRIQRDSTALGG